MLDLLIVRLALALLIGLLVGLERGWRERAMPAGSRTAGIRTYGLTGLLGGVLAALAQALVSRSSSDLGSSASPPSSAGSNGRRRSRREP
jgi:uncharacterized membrane protein YhiD involved in acid resistance